MSRGSFNRPEVAAEYARTGLFATGDDLAWLTEAAALTGRERVLDIGTAAGHTALALAPKSALTVGLDPAPAMLRQAQRLARERRIGNLELVASFADPVPFPDAVFDLFVPARDLAELDRVVFAGYLAGLREAGWDGDGRLVRLGMCASAIKYVWLPPLMLAQAGDATQLDYGGKATVDAARRYAERGRVFTFLLAWAREARELAAALGR